MVLRVPHVRWVGVVPTGILAGEGSINLIYEREKVDAKRQSPRPPVSKSVTRGNKVVLTLWENGSLVGVSSHESDEIVENVVIVNPTSSDSPSYEAIKESEPSRISSGDTRACR